MFAVLRGYAFNRFLTICDLCSLQTEKSAAETQVVLKAEGKCQGIITVPGLGFAQEEWTVSFCPPPKSCCVFVSPLALSPLFLQIIGSSACALK